MGLTDAGDGPWEKVQAELIGMCRSASGLTDDNLHHLSAVCLLAPIASLLTGFVIMCDWIASNQEYFPLTAGGAFQSTNDSGTSRDFRDSDADDGNSARIPRSRAEEERRVDTAWRALDFPASWGEAQSELPPGDELFRLRFAFPEGAKARPVQEGAVELARTLDDPGMFVIEAPMGEGKTEAALAAAEVLAVRFGMGGICISLPTMATTDAMFGRVHEWLKKLPSPQGRKARGIFLAHGKAQLNEEFQGLARSSRRKRAYVCMDEEASPKGVDESVMVSDWMQGRKRGMLANFIVCTVDQVLMSALTMKHVSLRQLSLQGKVVIIDECHAYDAYMREYLYEVLEWLGFWRTPVILLSATLPKAQRKEMIDAYLKGRLVSLGQKAEERRVTRHRISMKCGPKASVVAASDGGTKEKTPDSVVHLADGYPLISFTDGERCGSRSLSPSGSPRKVRVALMDDGDEELVGLLGELLSEGGCAAVICDTVSRAQGCAATLAGRFGEGAVRLVHARFTDFDRMHNERVLREELGPKATRDNGRRSQLEIVVGTQVLEQSLDIDFDVMVTDVAPIDLLMQRMGRLHRHGCHDEGRPKRLAHPCCLIRGIEGWADGAPKIDASICRVYEKASLLEAFAVLGLVEAGAACEVEMPADIAILVQRAYGKEGGEGIPDLWLPAYERASEAREKQLARKRSRAQACKVTSAHDLCERRANLAAMDGSASGALEERRDDDWGPRAVRDTQETIEVLLVRREGDALHLLPWVGDERQSVEQGAEIPTAWEPDSNVAKVVAQCAVRLPLAMCDLERIEDLIGLLEELCGRWVAAWQESPWLAGRLVLVLEEDEEGTLSAQVGDWRVSYTLGGGLSAVRGNL